MRADSNREHGNDFFLQSHLARFPDRSSVELSTLHQLICYQPWVEAAVATGAFSLAQVRRSLGEEREIVTFGGGRFFALGLVQTLCVVKYPLLTHVEPGVNFHTKAYA